MSPPDAISVESSFRHTRSHHPPPQQCLNAVTSYAPNNRSSSQLHTAGTGAQNNAQENKQTPNAQPAFIPPHLRGFNLLPRAHQSFTQPAPLHLQPTPVSRNASQSARIKGVPMKNDKEEQTQQYNPVNQIPVNHGMHNPTHLPPGHGIKRVSTTSAKMEEYPTAPTAEPVLEMKPPEASFLLYLNSKLTAAAAAKKKSNDHADKSFQALLVNSAAARAARYTVFAAPNAESDTVFKSFIAEKTNAPITNGRKYVLKSRQQTQQAISAVPKQGANQSSSFQTSNFIGNVPSSPRNEVGPYTAFGPGAEMKLGPMMRFEDVEDAREALFQPSLEPANSSQGLDDKVSDSGVEAKAKENVRAIQGQDPRKEFLDWDNKTWLPPPADWEHDRKVFDAGFMTSYIRQEWEPSVPRGPAAGIDTEDPKFDLAIWLGEEGFEQPIDHPMTIPDLANSDNPERQRRDTADGRSKTFVRNLEKRIKAIHTRAQIQEAQNREFELHVQMQVPEEHPCKPKTDVYLRPATANDAKGIALIYNHYVLHSLATEDQVPIPDDKVAYLIGFVRQENLPFIVAVKGKMPLPSTGKSTQSKKVSLPQFENIIGFGYAESYGYGLSGGRGGRSRYTASLHFYVHPQQTRLKVGQSLLDRLIQSLSYGYGAKDGYDWMDPKNDPIYVCGGIQKLHQLVIQYAIEQKNDPNYVWMKRFLRRYFFDEEGRIHRIARSQASGPGAKFADVVFFCKEVAAENEFGANI